MTRPLPEPGRRSTRPVIPTKRVIGRLHWWALTVVLLAGSAALLTAGGWSPTADLAAAQVESGPPSSTTDVAGSTRPPRVAPAAAAPGAPAAGAPAAGAPATPRELRSVPVELRIPAIGVAVPVSELGLNGDRTVEVPTDFARPGWFRLGPTPGQAGSAVILGHVDSYRGPAVFFELRSLRAGDAVEVVSADGAVAHFVVTAATMYPKDQFPGQQVYAAQDGGAVLNLVTCGGEFDRVARSYRSNLVVRTSLVGITAPAPVGAAAPIGGS